MRVLVQKVSEASVSIDNKVYNDIAEGLVIFVGFSINDTEAIISKMVDKIINLRILEDSQGKTNDSIMSKDLEILSISQFTLYANTRKGRRPSFTKSAKGSDAKTMYEYFNDQLKKAISVKTGVFNADMQISLINQGPFTIMLDSEEYGWHK